MNSLKVESLSINFGGVVAAEDVSFSVEGGEILGLIGPNGAGKSTTLNLISGLTKPDKGSVYLNGADISGVSACRRARMGIARTFQSPQFFQRATVADNLKIAEDLVDQMGFTRSFLGKKGHDFSGEFEHLMSFVDFRIDLNSDMSGMPYGQQKRLEIIRAILSHPKVLLVDEPAAGLNEKEQEQSVALIRYAAKQGVAVVLIEHKMDMIMNVCNRIVVLNFGRIIGSGYPKEIMANRAVIEAYLGEDEDAEDS